MTLPWYPKYPGDYARDTAHLTMLEHGAFNLLIDYYMATGGPISTTSGDKSGRSGDKQSAFAGAFVDRLYRICRAVNRDEQKAVDTVLGEFFDLRDGRYHNKRCDEILEKHSNISNKRREARAAREAKKVATNAGASAGSFASQNQIQNQNIKTPRLPTPGAAASSQDGFLKNGGGKKGGAFDIDRHLTDADREAAKKAAPGWDLYHLMKIYNEWVNSGTRDAPRAPGKGFAGWCAKYTKGKRP